VPFVVFGLPRTTDNAAEFERKYRICSRNFRPRVFHAPSYCSFTNNLTTCFAKKILNPKYRTPTLMLVLENKGLLLFGPL
jgi:hypothetical protein